MWRVIGCGRWRHRRYLYLLVLQEGGSIEFSCTMRHGKFATISAHLIFDGVWIRFEAAEIISWWLFDRAFSHHGFWQTCDSGLVVPAD